MVRAVSATNAARATRFRDELYRALWPGRSRPATRDVAEFHGALRRRAPIKRRRPQDEGGASLKTERSLRRSVLSDRSVVGVDVAVLRLRNEDEADDECHQCDDDRVPQALIDIARRRHDGEGGRRQEAAEPAV